MSAISPDEFYRRFLSLVQNQTLLPKKHTDLHLLFAPLISPTREYEGTLRQSGCFEDAALYSILRQEFCQ